MAGVGLVAAGCDLGTPAVQHATPGPVQALATGDVDGDGDIDAVVACACPSLTMLTNDGAGAFTTSTVPSVLAETRSAVLIDLDLDDKLDLALEGTGPAPTSARGTHVLMGDGQGGFGSAAYVADSASDGLPRPDVTGDGVPDMVRWPAFEAGFRLRVGDGHGGFAPAVSTTVPGVDRAIHLGTGEVDADGDDDLVVANAAGMTVLPNDGTGVFGPASVYAGPMMFSAGIGDLNGDGQPDIVASEIGLDPITGRPLIVPYVQVYLADGQGGFAAPVRHPTPEPMSEQDTPDLVDIDGDGATDMVFASPSGKVWVAFGDGAGGFVASDALSLLPKANGIAPAVVDIDGDSRPDILAGRDTGVAVYLNRS